MSRCHAKVLGAGVVVVVVDPLNRRRALPSDVIDQSVQSCWGVPLISCLWQSTGCVRNRKTWCSGGMYTTDVVYVDFREREEEYRTGRTVVRPHYMHLVASASNRLRNKR
ncbi:hypothetical protein C0Q70_06498 [Pomacea canaliculata]|uniref:Uncharacterized protein n=1 Tax=Pomacea canaliculata TaxID=400727 RepID=A0A2T7PPB4_POMCA|nr:hypothetical protein C0Q70_06498 [Pomacea canaliculata]